ncbi:MAG: ester cyclase [Candidatus Competibacter sp.]|nr:ester cyclase [Candidatus Competibacter sp.]
MKSVTLAEENKNLARRCIEQLWNEGKTELIAELIHPNFIRHHERNQDEDIHDLEGFKAWFTQTRRSLSSLQLTIEKILAENDRVMVYLRGHGTYKGELKDMAGTDTELTWTSTTLLRIADGKITECWLITDTLGILQRLGVIAAIG